MQPFRISVFVLGAAACSACGSEHDDAHEADGVPIADSGASEATPSEEAGASLQPLIQGDWSMPPGEEGYVCVRQTLTEDVFVSAFAAMNPPGTHHTLLTVGEPDEPDGVSDCNAAINKQVVLYGSGVGTNPMRFPDGVAMRIPAGSQLLLNLHVYNAYAEPLSGASGTQFQPLAEAEVREEAEAILAVNLALELPPQAETRSVATCTMDHDVTVFAVGPHMHQLGTHAKVVAERAVDGELVLHDGAYDFDQQLFYMIDPVALSQGDRVRVECTHYNDTDGTVNFGDSSFDEMCQTGMYRYPANGSSFLCLE